MFVYSVKQRLIMTIKLKDNVASFMKVKPSQDPNIKSTTIQGLQNEWAAVNTKK